MKVAAWATESMLIRQILRKRNGDTDPARIVIGKDTRRSSYMFEYKVNDDSGSVRSRFV